MDNKKVYHKPMMTDMTEYEMRTTSGGGLAILVPAVVISVAGIAVYALIASAGVVWNTIYAAQVVAK